MPDSGGNLKPIYVKRIPWIPEDIRRRRGLALELWEQGKPLETCIRLHDAGGRW
jgi:hypothetical protein